MDRWLVAILLVTVVSFDYRTLNVHGIVRSKILILSSLVRITLVISCLETVVTIESSPEVLVMVKTQQYAVSAVGVAQEVPQRIVKAVDVTNRSLVPL